MTSEEKTAVGENRNRHFIERSLLPRLMTDEYAVAIQYFDVKTISREDSRTIDVLADAYQAKGRGDPRMHAGLAHLSHVKDTDYAYTFLSLKNAAQFLQSIATFKSIKNVYLGPVEE